MRGLRTGNKGAVQAGRRQASVLPGLLLKEKGNAVRSILLSSKEQIFFLFFIFFFLLEG
jgi:hypothetical protein